MFTSRFGMVRGFNRFDSHDELIYELDEMDGFGFVLLFEVWVMILHLIIALMKIRSSLALRFHRHC